MFFFLSKVLSFLITPLIWVIGLLIYSILQRDQLKKKRALLLSVILLFLFSNSFLFNEAMKCWEVNAIHQDSLPERYDAGIVLGGISFYDSEMDRVQFNRSVDRLMQAVRLYKAGKISKIFFTGGSGSLTFPDTKEAPLIRKLLLELGIPDHDILFESESRNTRENAAFSKPILREKIPGRKHLLITSAFHMRRAVGCFEKQGIKVRPYATDRFSGPTRFQLDYLLIPSSEALQSWSLLIHEITGYIVYRAAGYI